MSDKPHASKPWDGRFNAPTDAFVERFTASIGFDQRLYRYDIQGSIAHAEMLMAVGILTAPECRDITRGLEALRDEIASGDFAWSVALEDVHMNIEHALVERIGGVGKKLHTARSRNDQVATDIRLYLRDESGQIIAELEQLMQHIIALAEREAATVMPGFTHLQTAQPVSFGHHLLAWFEMLARDRERLRECRERLDVMPLGAGALAGTTFPIDRELTAERLGFRRIAENSLDAVSDRDFVVEFCACASLIMMHFSRMAEELVLWNSQQFSFIELGDAFCTGSSMMPQKKNPDVPELVRGKSGRVFGHLMGTLTLMKSQALAYNKDNQEDKEPLFDTVDTIRDCIKAFSDLIPSLAVNADKMRAAAERGFATATDLADYLVRGGLAFREAHAIVGQVVARAIERDCDLKDLALDEFQALHPAITQDVYEILNVEKALSARDHFGGTAPAQVRAACARARKRLGDSQDT